MAARGRSTPNPLFPAGLLAACTGPYGSIGLGLRYRGVAPLDAERDMYTVVCAACRSSVRRVRIGYAAVW